jgi:hypothetical protein
MAAMRTKRTRSRPPAFSGQNSSSSPSHRGLAVEVEVDAEAFFDEWSMPLLLPSTHSCQDDEAEEGSRRADSNQR